MLHTLRRHPFPVTARFDYSLVLTYAFLPSDLQPLIPPPLTLDLYDQKWAFLAVALVQTRQLRPTGFPRFLGNDFFLAGYRVFVRYRSEAGNTLRGLYILKSETDKHRMKLLGNLFTHYNYAKIKVEYAMEASGLIRVDSPSNGLSIRAQTAGSEGVALPENAPFPGWREARRFAGPMPFTFTVDQTRKQVVIVEGVRENWKPEPVTVTQAEIPGLQAFTRASPILASAFITRNIPYAWQKGRIEAIRQ